MKDPKQVIRRTDSSHPEFAALVRELDAYLSVVDGDDHAFYDQYNKIDRIRYVVLAFADGRAVGCGSIKAFGPDAMEVKRMFTLPEARGRGVASAVLSALEAWAAELGVGRLVLETGKRQVEAVAFYERHGYRRIPNFGPYAGVENSVCFEKRFQ